MEELMNEAHALFCGGWGVKESQVFMSTLQHLLTAATKADDPDAAKTRCWATPQRWLLTLDTASLRAALWNPSTNGESRRRGTKESRHQMHVDGLAQEDGDVRRRGDVDGREPWQGTTC
ncbi:hypothetical protein ACQJBY_007638 [Aegilops geniculata]